MRFEFMQDRSSEIDRLAMTGLLSEILYQLTGFIAYRWFAISICIISAIILLLFIISIFVRGLE